MRPGHEYVPNPKSTSEIGESYETTGMARLAARTAKSKYLLYGIMMSQGEGEEMVSEDGKKRGAGTWRIWKSGHVMGHWVRHSPPTLFGCSAAPRTDFRTPSKLRSLEMAKWGRCPRYLMFGTLRFFLSATSATYSIIGLDHYRVTLQEVSGVRILSHVIIQIEVGELTIPGQTNQYRTVYFA